MHIFLYDDDIILSCCAISLNEWSSYWDCAYKYASQDQSAVSTFQTTESVREQRIN